MLLSKIELNPRGKQTKSLCSVRYTQYFRLCFRSCCERDSFTSLHEDSAKKQRAVLSEGGEGGDSESVCGCVCLLSVE